MGPTAVSGVREHDDSAAGRPPGAVERTAGPVAPVLPVLARVPDRDDHADRADRSWSSSRTYGPGMPDDAMTAPALQSVSRTLPAELSSVRRARDVVRDTLADWRADAIYDDVVLVASELVSNALQHALQPEPGPAQAEYPATVELSLRRDGEHVICAVSDPSQEPPIRRPGDVLAGSGHGLQLVDSLSLCWGWNVHETIRAVQPEPVRVGIPAELKADLKPGPGERRGKSVWAVFPLRMAPARVMGAA